MARVKKVNSQEVGLEIGLIFFKYFLKTEYLHYGLFEPQEFDDIWKLGPAQERYAEKLFSLIPEGTKTILDVGCGSGKTAQALTKLGYKVECVSPSKLLNKYAQGILGAETPVHTAKFEDFNSDKKFDLVMFSESFQYIAIDDAINGAMKFLKPNGHILVADFFKRDHLPTPGLLGGGHNWSEWEQKLPTYPLDQIFEQDITQETSGTLALVNSMTTQVVKPIYDLIFMLGEDRYPRIVKFVKWKWRKKLDKMENKHFTGQRNAEMFVKHKKYMMYLFQVK
jgi:SAM-dependent methyltransferase